MNAFVPEPVPVVDDYDVIVVGAGPSGCAADEPFAVPDLEGGTKQ